jgi:hypothetical protein
MEMPRKRFAVDTKAGRFELLAYRFFVEEKTGRLEFHDKGVAFAVFECGYWFSVVEIEGEK